MQGQRLDVTSRLGCLVQLKFMVCVRKQPKIKMKQSGGASMHKAFMKSMASQEGF